MATLLEFSRHTKKHAFLFTHVHWKSKIGATKGYQGTFSWTVRPKCGRFHLRMVQLALLRMKSQTHVSGHCVYAVYNEFLCSLSRQLQVCNFALKVVQTQKRKLLVCSSCHLSSDMLKGDAHQCAALSIKYLSHFVDLISLPPHPLLWLQHGSKSSALVIWSSIDGRAGCSFAQSHRKTTLIVSIKKGFSPPNMGGTYHQTRITWPSNMRIDPSNIGKKTWNMQKIRNKNKQQRFTS